MRSGRSQLSLVVLLTLVAMGSAQCQDDTVPRNAADTTPPELGLGTEAITREATTDTSNPGAVSTGAIRGRDSGIALAVAKDPESGVAWVEITGSVTSTCVDDATGVAQRQTGLIDVRQAEPDPAATQLGVQRAAQFNFDLPARRQCPAGSRFDGLVYELTAQAGNGKGQVSRTGKLKIEHLGPDILRVASFNLAQPLLSNHTPTAHAQLDRWATTLLNQADIVLLQEVRTQGHVERLAAASGLLHHVSSGRSYTDVAIISRYPLTRKDFVTIPASRTENVLLFASARIAGEDHELAVVHYDIATHPSVSNQWRRSATNTVLGKLAADPDPRIVGGDLNAYSGDGRTETDSVGATFTGTATQEVTNLRAVGADTYPGPPTPGNSDAHCAPQRIDYIFADTFRYEVDSYTTVCGSPVDPSDHGFVLATLRHR